MKGKGKIVSKKWIESCFTEQKRLPWRRFALDSEEQSEPESEEEIHCEWNNAKANNADMDIDSDDDMLIVDKRSEAVKQPNSPKAKIVESDSDGDVEVVVCKPSKVTAINVDDDDDEEEEQEKEEASQPKDSDDSQKENQMQDFSDDSSISSVDITTVECDVFKTKIFYLHKDLSATDKILLKDHIKQMLGVLTKNPYKADYVVVKFGKSLPINCKAEVVKEIWIRECFELKAFIPTSRYKITQE